MIMAETLMAAEMSKTKCLREHERDPAEPVFALEKDEDFFPSFKNCVKTNLFGYIQHRNQLIEQNQYKAVPAPFEEGDMEVVTSMALDQIKLNELRESDYDIYEQFRDEIKSKSYGSAGGDDDE